MSWKMDPENQIVQKLQTFLYLLLLLFYECVYLCKHVLDKGTVWQLTGHLLHDLLLWLHLCPTENLLEKHFLKEARRSLTCVLHCKIATLCHYIASPLTESGNVNVNHDIQNNQQPSTTVQPTHHNKSNLKTMHSFTYN